MHRFNGGCQVWIQKGSPFERPRYSGSVGRFGLSGRIPGHRATRWPATRVAKVSLAWFWLLLLSMARAQEAPAVRTVETPNAILRLDARSGDLVGLDWKMPALQIIAESRLGENFRLLLPRAGYEAAYFNSREQKVSRIETKADGVVCYYDSLRRDGEQVPVKVLYEIRAVGPQIQFSIQVDNPTDRPLAEVLYGLLGGLKGIADRLDTQSLVPGVTANSAPALFHSFSAGGYGGGNLGIRYDAAGYTYPGDMAMGWMDVYNLNAGLGYYYANQDPETRLSALYFEVRPFTKSAAVGDNWPAPEDLPQGEPVGLTMGWLNMPYLRKGVFRAGPVALQVHKGDWHAASEIYRGWFDRHFTVERPPDWLRQEMAWQSIIISNPEDVIVDRFRDLPELAANAKKYGVTTFEILGWDMGGIDRGYPQYRPNPRLGTSEEFRQALADIRAMGVHTLLFSNIQVADTATALFKTELSRYAVEGRWAPDWSLWGWGEGTISARMGLARSNMALVSPAHPQFRKFLMDQYLQMIRDGAEGFQLDKACLVSLLDFNPALPVSPDKSLIQGVLDTYRELLEKGRKINPAFSLASEIWVDRALPYVDVSYLRMGDIDMPSTAMRYTFPEWRPTIFGESPGDFNPMNNGMRYGMVWALAPRHYNDSLDEPLQRPLSRYVSELIRIRKQYRDLLFDGRFRDTIGGSVSGGPDVRYSVFENKNATQHALVLVNYGDQLESAQAALAGADGREVEISTPFEPDRKGTLPLSLTIPPHRCVVVALR